ncbi:class I SAM-dependent methyltransferase [uncultured Roseobacter sp.]|uniref:class I SAM-dependent methyltransferase n=1 Tax=uncultured Roseobacter sp. TaxID=114847 RepID=UPI00261BCA9D|nr:class I SAM-dependent methyltransferase [uncultured Roseobacter sp.]
MSRLESMRRRLTAQIDGLNWAAKATAGLTGDVLEMGLGNGRTYDHLRERMPDRRIWVIDRQLRAHPDCIPPERDFLEGEADAMLTDLARRSARMVLTHYDFGIGVPEDDAAEALRLSALIAPVMVPGGLVVTQQAMTGFTQIPGPESIAQGRYFFYRAG